MSTGVAGEERQVGTAEINAVNIMLVKLILTNFKGAREIVFEPNSRNAVVRGDNATYKTTLIDAFTWLLFDKDSQGKKEFEIKTLDKDNNPIHNLEHTVAAVLDVDGKAVTLKKVFKEKWTKKRGSMQADLTGHTTDYYVDEVPTPKRDYEARIKEMTDEDTFRLLTSATYFNDLHWTKRREILLSVCGDIADSDVIGTNPDLADLQKILDGRPLADHKKIVIARQKAINKRLVEIPARIDELTKSLASADGDPKDIKRQVDELDKDLTLIKAGGTASFEADILRLNNELGTLIAARDKEREEKKAAIRRQITDLEGKKDRVTRTMDNLCANVSDIQTRIDENEKVMGVLRRTYNDLDKQIPDVKTSCPACNQGLPAEDVQAAIDKFNEQKSGNLQKINDRGKALKTETEILEREVNEKELEEGAAERAVLECASNIKQKQANLDKVDSTVIGEKVTIAALEAKIEAIEEDKRNHKAPPTSAIEENLHDLRNQLARIENSTSTKYRIEDLEEEEKDLAGKYEKLERETFLMERFIVAKVDLLEGKINGMFDMARFKLFKRQINGGIDETCETTYDGVPFGSGLNNGARIAVGLDIVRRLQAHYKIHAPLFVDNRESVTVIPRMNCQTISLYKDEKYKELTVETI